MGQVFSFFCGLGNIRIGRKSAVRLIFLFINSEYNESDWLSNKREMLKKNMFNFIQKMHMREIERILGKRERILGERERECGER